MNISAVDLCALTAALLGIFVLGSAQLRTNISLFAAQAFVLSIATACCGYLRCEWHLYAVACALFLLKGIGVPLFLLHATDKVGALRDRGTAVPLPVSMHLGVAFAGGSFVIAHQLPTAPPQVFGWIGAAASMSLVCTGLLFMLTRRLALSQIIGFLIMENGIYLFGMTQTHGMPMLVEMGIILDVLVGVMLSGIVAFRISKSFEHIDVTKLAELRE